MSANVRLGLPWVVEGILIVVASLMTTMMYAIGVPDGPLAPSAFALGLIKALVFWTSVFVGLRVLRADGRRWLPVAAAAAVAGAQLLFDVPALLFGVESPQDRGRALVRAIFLALFCLVFFPWRKGTGPRSP